MDDLWNGLSLSETDPLTTNNWISRFSCGWHCISFKKITAVKKMQGRSHTIICIGTLVTVTTVS